MKLLLSVILCLIASACSEDRNRKKKEFIASGDNYSARGMYEEALNMYNKAIIADRMYAEAYYRAGVAAIKLQRWIDAAAHFRTAVELQPDMQDAYSQLAELYLVAYGRNPPMRKFIVQEIKWLSEKLQEQFPASYEDARVSGYLALFSNDKTAAVENFEKANKIRPYQQDVSVAYIQTLASLGRAEAAEKVANETIRGNPAAIRVYDELLWHYIRANRAVDVERILRAKVNNNPTIIDGYLELAAHYFLNQRWLDVGKTLDAVMANPTDFPFGPLAIGDFYLRVRIFHLAMWQYQRGIDQGGPNKHLYQKRMAEVLLKQNKAGDAQRLIQQVLKDRPTDVDAIAIRASLWVVAEEQKQYSAAISDFQKVLAQLPGGFVLRYQFGRALLLTGDVRGAIVQFQEAVNLRPDYYWPQIALAHHMIQTRRYGNALLISRGILKHEGINVPFDTGGQRPEERPQYEYMLAVRPHNPAVFNGLAAKLLEVGDGTTFQEALILSQRAKQLAARN